ncbi:MAG: hypothetical protein R2854_26270 [Caldilineaceae bacterium]
MRWPWWPMDRRPPSATTWDRTNPYDLFDAYAISEEVGANKPDAAMFLHALEQLAIPAAEYSR